MEFNQGIHKDIGNFSYINNDLFTTAFFTEEYCRYFIGLFEKLGFEIDNTGNYDTFINKVHGGNIICNSFLKIVERYIEPEILKTFTLAVKNRLWSGYPVPFIKKFSKTGQYNLKLHSDNSLFTLFVKLNDDFEGCDTIFPRQKWSTKDLGVGNVVIFPGVVTHPHYTTQLTSGVKYTLVGRVSILEARHDMFDDIENVVNEY